jgi:hypothetical protein
MNIRSMQRLGRQAVLGGGAGLLMGWAGAGSLFAQLPTIQNRAQPAAVQSAAPVQRNYLNKRDIQLPIQINDSARNSIKEIRLYSKDHPASPWVLYDKVGPAQKSFTFKAPNDGEYWFTMVTVDKQGRSYPSDLRNEPAGLSIVIDTQAPAVEMMNLGTGREGQLVQIEVADPNLDNGRVRFSYQAGDKGFRLLEPMVGRANVYCIPSQAVCTGLVQVVAEDLAGNQTTRQEHLSRMKSMQTQTSNTQPVGANVLPEAQPEPKVATPAPKTLPKDMGAVSPIGAGEPQQVEKTAPATQDRPSLPRPNGSDGPHWLEDKNSVPAKTNSAKSSDVVVDPAVTQTSNIVPKIVNGPSVQTTPMPTPTQTQVKGAPQKRQIVNSTKISLNYQIEDASPTSVARVEIWLTRDQGQSWKKHHEVSGHKSPIEVQLPGDGVYGLMLIPNNGTSAAPPPAVGEHADAFWVEVDTTKPSLQINEIQTSHDKGQAVVQIRWTAKDKNLADAPIELFYAATPQGPWISIAKGLPAEGQHHWTPPAGLGAQTHLQLIARDAAGNTTVCGTLEPVSIAEPGRPRAVIRNISTGAGGQQ